MKSYRTKAVIAGTLFILGTVFGILSGVVGGDVLSSTISGRLTTGEDLLGLVASSSTRLTGGAFLVLMMGISLTGMAIFLYPVLRKDNEELALGYLLFRGMLEGIGYLLGALGITTLVLLGGEYAASGAGSAALQSIGNVLYQFLDVKGAFTSVLFLIGTTCMYISLFRTRLIPRWLTAWGLIGVIPYMAYALLHIFHMDNGIGFYLQMVLAPQELAVGLWLIIKGFDKEAIKKLDGAQ